MYHVKYYIVGTYTAILYTRTAVVRGILFERLSLCSPEQRLYWYPFKNKNPEHDVEPLCMHVYDII